MAHFFYKYEFTPLYGHNWFRYSSDDKNYTFSFENKGLGIIVAREATTPPREYGIMIIEGGRLTRTPKSGVTTIVLTQPHSIEPALDNHLIHVA